MSLQQTKSILAKLLAAENITVEFRNVPTAYFDLKSRTITLPDWKNISPELYDLLGGHEVGHALATPGEGWHNAVDENVDKNFRTFLNVVEDARIERKIKDKFPGIRKSFVKGYRELMEKDFFGIAARDVNTMMLIDRINIHFKLGAMAGVSFKNEIEEEFVRRVDTVETWEEVVQVSKDLLAYCQDELQKMREERQEMMSQKMLEAQESGEEMGEQTDSDGDESEDEAKDGKSKEADIDAGDEDGEDGEPSDTDVDEFDEDFDSSDGLGSTGWSHKELDALPDEAMSETDNHFQEKVKTLASEKDVRTGIFPAAKDIDLSTVVVPWKNVVGNLFAKNEHFKADLYTKFESKNKAAINYLVKEFELRKKAAEMKRVSVSDTGIIDTNLLHSYKFNDDIFRKIAYVAEGKNHGMIAMVDWSGSMQNNMYGTIEQLLILTTFCRKINIPFEIYAFSTEHKTSHQFVKNTVDRQLETVGSMNLIQLLSSKMNTHVFRSASNELLNFGNAYNLRSDRSGYGSSWGYGGQVGRAMIEESVPKKFHLGGTPLNVALIAFSKVVQNFKASNKLEVVNTIVLSDGEDSDYMYLVKTDSSITRNVYVVSPEDKRSTSYILDPDSRMNFKVNRSVTDTILNVIKARTGCNLIGFFVVDKRKNKFSEAYRRLQPWSSMQECDSQFAKFRGDRHLAIENIGYDEYYLIPGGEDMESSDDSLDDLLDLGQDEIVSTRKLRSAFITMNRNRLDSRILLKKFIEKTT